jgi:putative protein kinase ArgK-like GTPase of G3E family
MTRISDDPMLVELGQQKDRIYAAWASQNVGVGNLVAELHAYRDLVKRCGMMERHRLKQAREELTDRLHGGWEIIERAPHLERHWLALLVRYEAVCDAMDVAAACSRLSIWETVHYLAHAS